MAKPKKQEEQDRRVFGPRKLGDGREAWDVRWRDERGKNRSRTYYSLHEANELASDIRFGRDNPDLHETITLGEYFGRDNVRKRIKRERKLSDKTQKQWLEKWNNHVCHRDYGISQMSLQDLSYKAPISDFLSGMAEAGVGESTQNRVLGIVSKFLDEAVEDRLMNRNPIRSMDPAAKPSTKRKHQIYIPTIQEIELLRLELIGHPNKLRRPYYGQRDALMVSLLAYEAPRPEELRLLDWTKVLWNKEKLHLHAPKAERGKANTLDRYPPLNEVVAAELTEWYDFLGQPDTNSPVIPLPPWAARVGGDHWMLHNWSDWRSRVFKPALERVANRVAMTEEHHSQLCRMRPYDLRHTAISLWLANGGKDRNGEWDGSPANPVDVSSWAGHEIATMFAVYAHVIETSPKVPIAEQISDARADVFVPQKLAA